MTPWDITAVCKSDAAKDSPTCELWRHFCCYLWCPSHSSSYRLNSAPKWGQSSEVSRESIDTCMKHFPNCCMKETQYTNIHEHTWLTSTQNQIHKMMWEGEARNGVATLKYEEIGGQDTTAATQDSAYVDGIKALSTWCTSSPHPSLSVRGTPHMHMHGWT